MKTLFNDTLRDIWRFAQVPSEQMNLDQTWGNRSKKILTLLLIEIPLVLIIGGIITLLAKTGVVNLEDHKLVTFIQSTPILWVVIFIVIFAPFLEELIFRFGLRFKTNFVVQIIIFFSNLLGRDNRIKTELFLKKWWTFYFKSIYYTFLLFFAFIHITNFNTTTTILILSPILVAPQFILGFFAGYLRLKYNFITGYILHALHNFILLVITFIIIALNSSIINTKTNEYSLEFTKSTFWSLNSSENYLADNINLQNITLKSIVAKLLNKNQYLILTNDNSKALQKYDLDYENKCSYKYSQNCNIVLENLSKFSKFRIVDKIREVQVWELNVEDSLKLNLNVSSPSATGNKTTHLEKEYKFENCNIKTLVNTLTSVYNIYIIDSTNTKEHFNINVPINNTALLQQVLKDKYGIVLEKVKKKVQFSVLNFY